MAPTSHICTGVICPSPAGLLGGNHRMNSHQQGLTARAHSSRSSCLTPHGLTGPVPCRPSGQRGRSVGQRSAAHRKMRMAAADACRLAVDESSACGPPEIQVSTKESCSLQKFQAPGVGDLPGKAEFHDMHETACELPGVEGDTAANSTSAVWCGRQCKTDEGVVMLTEEALKVIRKDTSLESIETTGNLFDVVGLACRNQDDSISEDGFSVESLRLDRTAHDAIDDMLINEIGLMSSMWDSDVVSVDLESLFQEPASHPETHDATSPDHELCSSSQSVVTVSAASFARLSSPREEPNCTSSSMPRPDVNSPGQLSLLTCAKHEETSSEKLPANCAHQAADVTSSTRPPLPRHSTVGTLQHLPMRPGQESLRAASPTSKRAASPAFVLPVRPPSRPASPTWNRAASPASVPPVRPPSRAASPASHRAASPASVLPVRPPARAASPTSHRAATCRSPRPSPLQSQDVSQMPEQASPRSGLKTNSDHASGTPLNACRARRKADQSPSCLTRGYGAFGAKIHNMDTPKVPNAHQVLE